MRPLAPRSSMTGAWDREDGGETRMGREGEKGWWRGRGVGRKREEGDKVDAEGRRRAQGGMEGRGRKRQVPQLPFNGQRRLTLT